MKLSSAYYCCDFHFADDLHRLMDLAGSHDLGALETLSKSYHFKRMNEDRLGKKSFLNSDDVTFWS